MSFALTVKFEWCVKETLTTSFWRSLVCDRYIMVCPPVRGNNPRALASGLSPVQADKLWYCITILYHLYKCRLAHCEIFRAIVGVFR